MRSPVFVVFLCIAVLGCKSGESRKKPQTEGQNAAPAAEGPATAEAAKQQKASAREIAWIHDDYAAALERARQRGLPLVVDMWAPWCHTCLSMKEFVLADPSLAELADRFVWVALDTDKEKNAAVQSQLPVDVWPTFYVVSPADASVQARHLGAASLDQFREFLAQGEGGHLDATGKAGELDPTLAAVREGDRHVIHARYQEAAEAYDRALKRAGAGWKRRPEILLAKLTALDRGQVWKACTELGAEHAGEVAASLSSVAADFAYRAHRCASELGTAERKQMHARLTAADGPLRVVLEHPESALSLDDRSDAMRILRVIELAEGNEDQAMALAEKQRALLDRAAAEAPNAFARMTYMWPRSEVYVFLGEAEKLIPEVVALAEKLPDQYDPPFRLAWLQLNTGDYDQAVANAQKAMKMMYGPRRAQAYRLLAKIHAARGDREAQHGALEGAVATYRTLKDGHENPAALARAEKALAELDGR